MRCTGRDRSAKTDQLGGIRPAANSGRFYVRRSASRYPATIGLDDRPRRSRLPPVTAAPTRVESDVANNPFSNARVCRSLPTRAWPLADLSHRPTSRGFGRQGLPRCCLWIPLIPADMKRAARVNPEPPPKTLVRSSDLLRILRCTRYGVACR